MMMHRFDTHADVCEALSDAALSCAADQPGGEVARQMTAVGQAVSAGGYLSGRLEPWRATMQASAHTLARTLPFGASVDLLAAFAAPWSHALALQLAGVSRHDGVHLLAVARQLFLASAHATSRLAIGESSALAGELARALPDGATPLAVQSFVAVSQTLPHTLAGAWLLLAQQPEAWRAVQQDRGLMPRAVEELLRLASPARAVYRRARADVSIGAVRVRAGDEVVLLLDAANRDARRFPDPLRIDLQRGDLQRIDLPRGDLERGDTPHGAAGHVGLGRGNHPCAGGALVRLALSSATEALLDVADTIRLAAPVTWLDGATIRAPATVPVMLHGADWRGRAARSL